MADYMLQILNCISQMACDMPHTSYRISHRANCMSSTAHPIWHIACRIPYSSSSGSGRAILIVVLVLVVVVVVVAVIVVVVVVDVIQPTLVVVVVVVVGV